MNQAVKDAIYRNGTEMHLEFLAKKGGMTDIETKVLRMMHEGKTDLCIQTELGFSKNTYARIEEYVRRKLLLAVFDCINNEMKREHN